MIARSPQKAESPAWVSELRAAYTQPAALLRFLELAPQAVDLELTAAARFAFRVPQPYARRMRVGDATDPLLRQVLPIRDELREVAGFTADPVGDLDAQRQPGFLHKYHGRALLLLSGACAINCRYCFRREFPYQGAVGAPQLAASVTAIAADTRLNEVILSGGDPLLMHDPQLAELLQQLSAIPHLRRLRIHTRLPLVLPSRVTADLLESLGRSRLKPILVLHVNHAQEIDQEVVTACAALTKQGVTLLNQAVLLRGVNDNATVLADLSEALFEAGILPYYLHLLDPVRGAAHFNVPETQVRVLQTQLQARLSGYLVPRIVREVAGAPSKIPFY
jgi:L-lysine 2,3-aminomutase